MTYSNSALGPLGVLWEAEVQAAVARVEPAGGDNLAAGEEVDALGAVGVGVAEERVLPAAEGVVGHGYRDWHVDANHTDLNLVLEATCGATVVCEDCCAVAVGVGVDGVDAFFEGLNTHHGQDRAEDLIGVDGHVGGDIVEQGWVQEEALAIGIRVGDAAVKNHGGTCCFACIDVAGNLVAVCCGDKWAHVAAAGSVAHAQGLGAFCDLGNQFIGNRVDGNQCGDGHAAFARCAEAGVDRRVSSQIKIGIREYQHVVLCPAQCLNALAVCGAGCVDILGDGGGAHEGNRGNTLIGQQDVNGFLIPVDNVEDAVRQTGFLPEFCHPLGCGGVLFRGLQHHGVTRGDGDREEPHRNHRREVEGGDNGRDAKWLTDRVDIELGGGVLRVAALDQVWDAASKFDDFLAAGDFAQCVIKYLAVFGGDDRGELALALVEQFAVVEQDCCAAGQRGVAPCRECCVCCRDDLCGGFGTGQRYAGADFSGGWVHNICVAGVCRSFEGSAVGPVSQGLHEVCVLSRHEVVKLWVHAAADSILYPASRRRYRQCVNSFGKGNTLCLVSAELVNENPVVPGMLSVARILELPVVQAGAPEILSGHDSLGNSVRWVHVTETADLAELLTGGELVLSTGLAFGESGTGASVFLNQVHDAGAVGIIVELVPGVSRNIESSIAALREAAHAVDFPVILLHRRVRFVEITEVVHRMLVSDQLAALERSRTIHEVFTALSLENATEEEIVARAAELVGAPIILEDVAHLVLAFAAAGAEESELLGHWAQRSRRVGYLESTGRGMGEESWLQTPVGVRGQRWGRLVAPVEMLNDQDAAMVLERAGQTLTIARLAGRDQKELLHQARAGLLHELRQAHSLSTEEVLVRAMALGLNDVAHYVPVVLRLDTRSGQTPTGLQLRERELLDALLSVLDSARATALSASLQSGQIGMVLGIDARQLEEPLLERIFRQLAREQINVDWSVGVGHGRPSVKEAARSLDEAVQVAEIVATFDTRARPFYRFADVRLHGLLAVLQDDTRVKSFAEAELAGILDPLDESSLELLGLYLKHGGNKSALARTGFLSRPALYARLEKLEDKLGVSLEDAESRTSLHVALLWLGLGKK